MEASQISIMIIVAISLGSWGANIAGDKFRSPVLGFLLGSLLGFIGVFIMYVIPEKD